MKIYNRNTGYVYYDNQPGTSDADDPATFVGANSSIVIQGPQSVSTTANEATIKEEAVNENVGNKLQLVVYPNPTGNHFTVQAKTNDATTKLLLQIFDQQGRLIEKKDNLLAGSVIQLGEMYRPGIYYVRIQQGSQHSEMKLVKLSN
jgi:Secretion system C-terminal sorting domain